MSQRLYKHLFLINFPIKHSLWNPLNIICFAVLIASFLTSSTFQSKNLPPPSSLFSIFSIPSLEKEGERGIKYASFHFLCDSTYPGKRIFKMTEICQVHGDIAYLSQRKQNFLEHLRTFHWFLWSSFAQNIIIQANHIKAPLFINWFIKVIEFQQRRWKV